MGTLFDRYTEPARRAIFFARFLAVMSDAREITSVDLLASLLFEDNSRAQTLFQLRDRFPLYCGRPHKYAKMPPQPNGPLLDEHAKQILIWAEHEATRMGDYWIDTEHILLGIVGVPISTAANYLARAGLTIDVVRETILDNRTSRPDYGPVTRWWPVTAWLRRVF